MPDAPSHPPSPVAPANGRTPTPTGIVIPHRPSRLRRLAAWILYQLARGVSFTIRFQWHDQADLLQWDRRPVIYCIWHNRLALSVILFKRVFGRRQPDRRMAAMVSASRDGGLLTHILELFRVKPVRGSTSRRGPQALLEMTSMAKQGCDLAITPDGPRGPVYEVQEGVIALAQLTGLPIIPVVYNLSYKYRIQTWDRFHIPLPLAKCDVHFGEPICVPEGASEEQRDQLRRRLEEVMRALVVD